MSAEFPVVIYCLRDPRDNSVKYVGQTVREGARELAHRRNDYHGNREKFQWGEELKAANLQPVFEILEKCDYVEANQKELEWSRRLTEQGEKLLNRPVGAIRRDDLMSSEELLPWYERLTAMRDELTRLIVALRNECGPVAKKESKNIADAVRNIDSARHSLESRMCDKRDRRS